MWTVVYRPAVGAGSPAKGLYLLAKLHLPFSVADGIALGFITYVALKAGTGKYKEISASLWVLCAIFIAKFVFL